MKSLPEGSHCHEVFHTRLERIHRQTDFLFGVLFGLQWIFAIVLVTFAGPLGISATYSQPSPILVAVLVGGLLSALPIAFALVRPAAFTTRLVVATCQIGYSALLIYLTDGHLGTHFHVFGSLAFLSFYRDWRVYIPAMVVVGAAHVVQGLVLPESVVGLLASDALRPLEHAGWLCFEAVFLVWGCVTSVRELREMSRAQADAEELTSNVERKVDERTRELAARSTELEEWIKKGQMLELQLLQAQKLESIGQLAAGVAHEINTPMQYVSDNVVYFKECTSKLFEVVGIHEHHLYDKSPTPWAERVREVEDVKQRCHYSDIVRQVPEAIEECIEGIRRVIHIVRAMKQLSHPGTQEMAPANINDAVRSTVTITTNRWKYVANLHTDLDEHMPEAKCLIAEINQVLLNLIVNAADAIAEKNGEGGPPGNITVRTRYEGKWIYIEVEDDGAGMPDEIRNRIFDPFFTTKEVGKGTGQGLTISHNVIVNMHHGTLDVQSRRGEGTCFIVGIPVDPPVPKLPTSKGAGVNDAMALEAPPELALV